jgi:hypothetical protein
MVYFAIDAKHELNALHAQQLLCYITVILYCSMCFRGSTAAATSL